MGICASVMLFQQRGCKHFETGAGAHFSESLAKMCCSCRAVVWTGGIKENVTKRNNGCGTAKPRRRGDVGKKIKEKKGGGVKVQLRLRGEFKKNPPQSRIKRLRPDSLPNAFFPPRVKRC